MTSPDKNCNYLFEPNTDIRTGEKFMGLGVMAEENAENIIRTVCLNCAARALCAPKSDRVYIDPTDPYYSRAFVRSDTDFHQE